MSSKPSRRGLRPRTPTGALSRAGRERELPPTQVKRLRDAALAGLRDPEWGTELGRLYLAGTISASMYAAGKDWREKAARYIKTLDHFPVRTLPMDGRGGSAPADPDSEAGAAQARREAGAMERFFEAHHVLLSSGRLAERAVRHLCERDQGPCGMAELIALRNGLSALADHREAQSRRKRTRNA